MRKSVTMGLMAGVLGMGLATAEVKVSDVLSLSGFADMSAFETNDGPVSAGLDQFELDFKFKFSDMLSAQVDLSQGGVGGGKGAMVVEQGFVTYTSGATSLMVGKFLSATGWESAEPTGTYQYSYSATVSAYGGYNTGVGANYTLSPMVSLYGALFTSEWGTDASLASPAGEAGVTLAPATGVTVKGFVMAEAIEDTAGDYTKSGVNVWASYAMGPLLLAAEVNYLMNATAEDDNGLGLLLFANYKLTDKLALTGRYSQLKTDAMAAVSNEITVSPTLILADNWWVLAEVRQDIEASFTSYGVETTITF